MIGGHGGNIYQLARRLGCRPADISDMSANVNPLGPIPELMEHLKENMEVIAALPEVDAGAVVEAFGQAFRVDPHQVMAGNGTTELIYLIPRALNAGSALVVGPTYSDYRDACAMHRVPCDHVTSIEADNFMPDLAEIERRAAAADLVFWCNPNNPTGTLVRRADIEALCRALPQTIFVIDESYLPFAPNPAETTLIAADLPNVIVLNSMSKAFRIPGLRIGFVKAPPALISRLAPYALPWSVNSMAQAAVAWLMAHHETVEAFLSSTRGILTTERAHMQTEIRRHTAIRCFPSATSFLLMRLPEGLTAPMVWRHMAGQRILIRDCSNFTGLSDAYIRISLKKAAENRRATDLLVQLVREQTGGGNGHGR